MGKSIYELCYPDMFIDTQNNSVFCVVNKGYQAEESFVRFWVNENGQQILKELKISEFIESADLNVIKPVYLIKPMDSILQLNVGSIHGVDLHGTFYKIYYERIPDDADSNDNLFKDEFFEEEKQKSLWSKVVELCSWIYKNKNENKKVNTKHSFKGRLFNFIVEEVDIKNFDVGLIFVMLEQQIPDIYNSNEDLSFIATLFPKIDYDNYQDSSKNIMSYQEFMMYLKGAEDFLYKISLNFTILQCTLFNRKHIFYWMFCSELLRSCYDKNHVDYNSKTILPIIDIPLYLLFIIFSQDTNDGKKWRRFKLVDNKSSNLFEITDTVFLRNIQEISIKFKLWALYYTINTLLKVLKNKGIEFNAEIIDDQVEEGDDDIIILLPEMRVDTYSLPVPQPLPTNYFEEIAEPNIKN